jgi:hypothetical protein
MADSERTITKDELTKLLAPALGQEKSDEVVVSTARSLGFSAPLALTEQGVSCSEIGGRVDHHLGSG